MQMYRGLPILTNQPSRGDRKGIPHHLIGFLPLQKDFSAAAFSRKAQKILQDIVRRRKVPILVGGSGFYLKALLEGSHAPVAAHPTLRKKYQRLLKEKGGDFLYQKLRAIDPRRARKIHPNDTYRVIRALEIHEVTGKKPSEFEKGMGGIETWFEVKKIGLRKNRKRLYRQMDERVERMIRGGAMQEVKRCLGKKLSRTAKKIIGIQELSSTLKGKFPLEEAVSHIQRATRRYAKRQETWFRREKGVRWHVSSE